MSKFSAKTNSNLIIKIIIDDHSDDLIIHRSAFEKYMKFPDHESIPWEHVYDLSLSGFSCNDEGFIEVCDSIGEIFYGSTNYRCRVDPCMAYINKFVDVYVMPYRVKNTYEVDVMLEELCEGPLNYMLMPYDAPQKNTYDFTEWIDAHKGEYKYKSSKYIPVGDMRDMIAFLEIYYTSSISNIMIGNDWFPTMNVFIRELNISDHITIDIYKDIDYDMDILPTKRSKQLEKLLDKGSFLLVLATEYKINDICYKYIAEKLRCKFENTAFPEHIVNRMNNLFKNRESDKDKFEKKYVSNSRGKILCTDISSKCNKEESDEEK